MQLAYNPYMLLPLFAMLMALVLAYRGWRYRTTPLGKTFLVLMFALAWWSLAVVMEHLSTELPAKVFWMKMSYFGITTIPITWLVFTLQYTYREKWLTRRNLAILLILPVTTLVVVWTNNIHHLMWKDIWLDTSLSSPVDAVTHNTWFWVYATYAYSLLLLGTLCLLGLFRQSSGIYRKQAGILLLAAFVPWAGNILFIAGIRPFSVVDPTPLAFAITGVAFFWGLSHLQLLDIMPIAHEAILRSMVDGVIVLDTRQRIIELNPAAEHIIDRKRAEVIGQPYNRVLPGQAGLLELKPDMTETKAEIALGEGQGQRYYRVYMTLISTQRHLNGHLLLLHDDTERRKVEVEARERVRLEAELNERKRAEEVLRESEERYRTLFESAAEGILIADMETKELNYANPAICKMLGYSQEELTKMSVSDIHPKDSLEYVLADFAAQARGEKILSPAFPCLKKDGTIIYADIKAAKAIIDGRECNIGFFTDITERKRAEETLAASEKNFRHSMDNSPLGIRIVNADGETVYANRAMLDIYGYDSLEEFNSTPTKQRYTPESYAEHRERVEKRQRGEYIPSNYEISIVRKDGKIRHLEVLREEVLWDGKKQYQVLYNDITEHKKAEDEIRESRTRFRELAMLLPLSVWETNENGLLTYTNQETMKVYGYTRLDTAPISYLQNLIPQDRDRAMKNTQRIMQGETLGGIEYTALRKDGSTFASLIYASAIIRNGIGIGLRGITIDTTEQKKAAKRLEEAAQEWRTTFDSITDMVSILDDDSRIIRVNRAYANMLKKEPQELLGKACYEMIHNTDRPHHDCPHQKTLQTGKPAMAEYFEPTLGTYIEASTSPIFNENGDVKGSVYVMRDISERKQMQEQLMAQDRLASIGQLVSGVAHEINNPLTGIIGFSELLLARELPDDIKSDLKVINDEAQRTAKIVKNLLTFARKQPEGKAPVDINENIRKILNLRDHEQKVNNIQVITHFASDLPQVMGNTSQLQQVFFNIVINAEFFMLKAHARGTLTITTERTGDFVHASFMDDGPGISEEHMRNLFTPFFTTKDVGKGTGLGLSICHGIITEHGGRIYTESEEGKGATFIVELPIKEEATSQEAAR